MLSASLSRGAIASVGPGSAQHASSWHQGSRRAPRASGAAAVRSRRTSVVVAVSSGQQGDNNDNNESILDAFFVGRALAETLNERLGQVAGNVLNQATTANFGPDALLAEAQKRDAEFREEIRKFQEEVMARARAERIKTVGGSQLAPPADGAGGELAAPAVGSASSPPPAVAASSSAGGEGKRDVSEAIDDLRSQVSRARYEVQKMKNTNN